MDGAGPLSFRNCKNGRNGSSRFFRSASCAGQRSPWQQSRCQVVVKQHHSKRDAIGQVDSINRRHVNYVIRVASATSRARACKKKRAQSHAHVTRGVEHTMEGERKNPRKRTLSKNLSQMKVAIDINTKQNTLFIHTHTQFMKRQSLGNQEDEVDSSAGVLTEKWVVPDAPPPIKRWEKQPS